MDFLGLACSFEGIQGLSLLQQLPGYFLHKTLKPGTGILRLVSV